MSVCTAAKIDAEQRGGEAQRERDDAPPPQLAVEQVEGDAQQAVDRRLQHHAAHQRRDRRRRGRMRFRQPDVQRQEPGLGAEARTARGRTRRSATRPVSDDRAHRAERVVAAAALQHAEAEQDRDRADVRDQQVEEAGAADLGNPMVGRDEEIRGERHRLPRDHEHVGVVGDQHQRHRGEEHVVLEADAAPAPCPRRSGNSRPRRARSRRRARPAAPGRTPTARRGAGGTAGRAGRAAAPSTAAAGRSRRRRRPRAPGRPRRPAGNSTWRIERAGRAAATSPSSTDREPRRDRGQDERRAGD